MKLTKRKVRIHLVMQGRLGNQLFQLCAAKGVIKAFEERAHVQVICHNMSETSLTAASIVGLSDFDIFPLDSLICRLYRSNNKFLQIPFIIRRNLLLRIKREVVENTKPCELNSFPPPRNLLIHSTFQNTNWLGFVDPTEPIVQRKKKLGELLRTNSPEKATILGLHFSFGDFLNPNLVREYGYLSSRYYEESLHEVLQEKRIDKIVVFSEDKELAIQRINEMQTLNTITRGSIEVSHSRDYNLAPHDELLLMSMCDALILSNSSFSWWGAYLAKESTLVVAPEPIYRRVNKEDVVKGNWTRVYGYD